MAASLFVNRGVVATSARSGKWRMLCLGDSNTYGVYVDRSEAYPVVFERPWNASRSGSDAAVEVFNLGYPGTNSSKLAQDFLRMLFTFQPDVVTVMIGANDLRTIPATAGSRRAAATAWRRSSGRCRRSIRSSTWRAAPSTCISSRRRQVSGALSRPAPDGGGA